MSRIRKLQRTVAGVNDSRRTVFVVTTNSRAAEAAWASLIRGWYAIDGTIVRRKGELTPGDQEQIDVHYRIQESFRDGKKAIIKKRAK